MRGETGRWPAEIVTHIHKPKGGKPQAFHCRVDFTPEGKPHGFYIYRGDRTGQGHEIDDILDEISRKGSRVMQGRYP
jgi:hypothetical protein